MRGLDGGPARARCCAGWCNRQHVCLWSRNLGFESLSRSRCRMTRKGPEIRAFSPVVTLHYAALWRSFYQCFLPARGGRLTCRAQAFHVVDKIVLPRRRADLEVAVVSSVLCRLFPARGAMICESGQTRLGHARHNRWTCGAHHPGCARCGYLEWDRQPDAPIHRPRAGAGENDDRRQHHRLRSGRDVDQGRAAARGERQGKGRPARSTGDSGHAGG
jgi:hypothetical protein